MKTIQKGFTLVELLTVLAILAILTTISVPSLREFVQAGQMRSAAFDLVVDLSYARSEAVKRNADVVVEQITAGAWEGGWRVRGGTDADAPVLRERNGITGQVRVDAGVNSLVFGGNGRLQGVDGVTTIEICPPEGLSIAARAVQIQLTGMARSVKGTCA